MEGKSAPEEKIFSVLPKISDCDEPQIFWFYLQECHDYGDEPEVMRKHLHEFADKHGLTIPA